MPKKHNVMIDQVSILLFAYGRASIIRGNLLVHLTLLARRLAMRPRIVSTNGVAFRLDSIHSEGVMPIRVDLVLSVLAFGTLLF